MRKVRIGAVSFLLDETPHTIEKNIERALSYIDEASALGCDIVCLPEHFNVANVPGEEGMAVSAAQTIPGPLAELMASQAKKRRMHVVANFPVKEGDSVFFNQTTFFDRAGEIAGTYRKLQPTASEYSWGKISPGDELPVIELDFGRVACMICMDIYFPEIARIYSLKGAEIVFWPTVSHGPTEYNLETQICARAMDYSIYMAESNCSAMPPYAPYAGRWSPGRARIVDFEGRIIADTGHRPGIAFADIDLDEKRLAKWVVGINETDEVKDDLNRLVRLDVYSREFSKLDKERRRVY